MHGLLQRGLSQVDKPLYEQIPIYEDQVSEGSPDITPSKSSQTSLYDRVH